MVYKVLANKSKFSLRQSFNGSLKNNKSFSAYSGSEKAGPGAYNLPSLLGHISIDANKRNYPAFSIGSQSKDQLLILCKNQAEAMKGQSSPGVCKYDGDLLTLKAKAPNATFGREKRFKLSKKKLNNSIQYHSSIDRKGITENMNKTNGFPKSIRFLQRDKILSEKEQIPSSQNYNHSFYGSIED
mmetsp:Transcript_494/g.542  ORF Transcript_494/g.542 Transcript_494/m.542 type:complete len:185 (+) Transcript_494:174-728(+)